MVSKRRSLALFGLMSCSFLVIGCSGRSDLGIVNGTVTLDGKPLENAFVEFTPKSSGSVATGRTNANGEYTLMFSRDVKGASLGENLVRISTYDITDQGGKEVRIPEKVPAKYNLKSELVATVEPGTNQRDFELKSSGQVAEQKGLPGL